MIVKIHRSGQSFRSAAEYCLGDKVPEREEGEEKERKKYQEGDPSWTRGIMSDRVAWTQTLNLSTDDPYKASRMMAATVSYAPTLKQRAEVKAGGRELAKPVCHYSLSWKEGEQPSRPEMIRAAETTLAVLQMPSNQALLVAHRDTDCAHVHVIANRVSWEDGRAAKLQMSRLNLSRWAEGYERSRGEIQCARRVEHNRIRSTGEAVYDRESRRDADYHRDRREDRFGRQRYADGSTPQEKAEVAEQRAGEQRVTDQCRASMKERRESIDVYHNQQWRDLYQRQERERKDLKTTQRGRKTQELDPERESQDLECRHLQERADLGRRHARTAQQLRNLYCAEYAHGIFKKSSYFSLRMDAEKGVTVAKQALRASLQSELSGKNRSGGGGAPVKIKGLDDDEEEHEHSWGR
ncbi:MAG: relaxase/mobilization nuclease domain-containing protein [Gemmatimonadota bacterium]|nr:relaxase/mobilization nuclease domain-containing protein [Gemmatimonadota bacterium]